MHKKFKQILWLTGHFGVIVRENAQMIVYKGKYGHISANRTLSKLEKEYGFLRRMDRGKRKTDGFSLTQKGVKEFRRLFGYEPRVYVSLDKLSHSIKVQSFYCHMVLDMIKRELIPDDIIEDKKIIDFTPHKMIEFFYKNKERFVISDAFVIYRYSRNRGIAFNLEIENSNRKSSYIAKKTLDNYEGYFISELWREEPWQPKSVKVFPPILIVCYSEFKAKDIARWMKKKIKIDQINYFFTWYDAIEREGISGEVWFDLNGDNIKLIG